MSFEKRERRFVAGRARRTLAPVVRLVTFAFVAVVAAAWGLARHFTQTLPPMRVPVAPAPSPTYDADAGEVPVPDLERAP